MGWATARLRVTLRGRVRIASCGEDTGAARRWRRGRSGRAVSRTVRWRADGGAANGRLVWPGVPKMADIPTTLAMAPPRSAAARTRAQVPLMFLPRSVDTSIKGSIGIPEEDLRGSFG